MATAEMLRRWFALCEVVCREQRDYLTQLDAAIGDADHGANMDRAFVAVNEDLAQAGPTPGSVLAAAGETFITRIGGASGALWGTALRRAGAALGEVPAADPQAFAAALDGALAGIVELGVAEEGDKTMVDALAPALRALHAAIEGGDGLADALAAASAAAEAGMQATAPLQAAKGRASYLGERSIGHIDPGAASTAFIVAALRDAAADDP